MTKMIIDNKATAKRAYEAYEIDRNEYRTVQDLMLLAGECMNENVYLIRVYENDSELFTMRNSK